MRHVDYYLRLITQGGHCDAPTGTTAINITANGTTKHNVAGFAEAAVTVAVPEPSGKVTITRNGVQDVKQYAQADVQVPGPTGKTAINITANGKTTHDVAAYAEADVIVAVPGPTGTKTINIAKNGTTTEDVAAVESAKIVVAVPEPTGVVQIAQNGTVDVKQYAQANVQVPGPAGKTTIDIKANGKTTHNVAAFAEADVVVAVPGPTGKTAINIKANGKTTHNVADFETAEVTVAVPEPTGSVRIRQNGTVDVKKYAQAEVWVQGYSSWVMDGPSGQIEDRQITQVRSRVFNGSMVTSVNLPNCTVIGYNTFADCTRLTAIHLPTLQQCGTNAFSNTSITELDLPALTRTDRQFCANNSKLTTVHMPKLQDVDAGYAFMGCASLVAIDIPVLTRIGISMFSGCQKLPVVQADKCTAIDFNAFSGCTSLHTVDILGGNFINALAQNKNNALRAVVFRDETTVTKLVDATDWLPTEAKVYVPDVLVAQYKTASNWVRYATQIVPLSTYVPLP